MSLSTSEDENIVICLFLGSVFIWSSSVYCLHAGVQPENHQWKLLLDNELSSLPVGAKQPEGSEQSSNNNSWVYGAADNKYRPSWKRATYLIKMYIMIVQSGDSVMEPSCKWYKSIQGCHRDIIFYY